MSLGRGIVSLFHPKMLALLVVPLLVAVAVWALSGWYFWTPVTEWLPLSMKMVSLPDPVITCDVLAMAVPLSTETTTLLSPLPALMTLPAPRAVWVP